MEFIFELFAEILGRAEDSIVSPTTAPETAKANEAAALKEETEPAAEAGLQEVNIFNVVNFH